MATVFPPLLEMVALAIPFVLVSYYFFARGLKGTPVFSIHQYKNNSGDYLKAEEDTNTQSLKIVLRKKGFRRPEIAATYTISGPPIEMRLGPTKRARFYRTREGEAATLTWFDKNPIELSASSMVVHEVMGKSKKLITNLTESLPNPFKNQIMPLLTGFFGGMMTFMLLDLVFGIV
jgi:hypothetical protein